METALSSVSWHPEPETWNQQPGVCDHVSLTVWRHLPERVKPE